MNSRRMILVTLTVLMFLFSSFPQTAEFSLVFILLGVFLSVILVFGNLTRLFIHGQQDLFI